MRFLITGGAGFIGSNTTRALLDQGHEVVVFDNLSRAGSDANLAWLKQGGGELVTVKGDVRERDALEAALQQHGPFDVVLHFAAQVAVTTSVLDPALDFEINAKGTFNVLEAVRHADPSPILLYASTNKVYGGLEGYEIEEAETRYEFAETERGVPEFAPLDFHSPYGCSKGAADQYVRDYHRIYGLRTIVFRNSCIYGPRQFGIEDQGWLAWFVIAAVQGKDITIFGDGKQVRDVLYIDDLVDAMVAAVENIETTQGQVYNMGGGPENSLSVWAEFGPMLEELEGSSIPVQFEDWRPGDQRVYISDISKAQRDFGWTPQTSPEQGVRQLYEWVRENQDLVAS
ncbi:MAG: SDR family NAD(P)-dependent oxidoreductase [Anaerolineales bacterium]|nr:SDR family NAD(P)-dependent oxidoreductase [Anaerolineales bacterium]